MDYLSPYEIFQLERYGNILNNANPEDEWLADEPKSTSEENYIFNQENPQ